RGRKVCATGSEGQGRSWGRGRWRRFIDGDWSQRRPPLPERSWLPSVGGPKPAQGQQPLPAPA
ncbi:unnamed protein product, partial [Discosporangium mesarthrocarpum]